MIYLTLFLEFFKIGLFCFGGAFGMIPLIEETVMHHGWLSEAMFFDLIGVCESTPGPIAVNMATYIGLVQGGILGCLAAVSGVVLPSFMIILLIAAAMKNLTETKLFRGFISGVQPVVIALILFTGLSLFLRAMGYVSLREFRLNGISMLIFALLSGLYFLLGRIRKKRLTAVEIIVLSAVLGIAVCLAAERI